MTVEIKEVITKSDINKFIRFPYKLYKDNPYWVPSLDMDEKLSLSKEKNPAFEFCEARYWLAYKEGEIVGRIGGIINHRANECWKENRVRFGWIDFINDESVAKALLQTVEQWGKENGCKEIHGPLGFTDMDREGMLVFGFDELGTYATIYNHAYYPEIVDKLGYQKDIDWLQFEYQVPKEEPEKLRKIAEMVAKRYNVHTLKVKNTKELKTYALEIFTLLNQSFLPLYGFAPLSERQIELFTKQYISYVNPEYISCVMSNETNEMLGFGITLPSLSEAVIKAKGQLFPFGWWHLLKAMKNCKVIDMYLIAIRPDWQNKGLNALMFDELMRNYIKNGVQKTIQNPVLEINNKNIDIWKDYNPRQHIRRRCYIKKIN
ncbi:MAG: GNAT family N-acetyltransferase [Bacteroidales bacterium]